AADVEVILCAGAIASPHLLMLSGIGPADLLRTHGIEVRAHLPGVGANLHDHVQTWVGFPCRTGSPLATDSNLGEAGGFVRTDGPTTAADVQLSFLPMLDFHSADRAGLGFIIGAAVTRPESRGRVELISADAWRQPLIDPNYLVASYDRETLVAGATLAL